MITFEHYYLNIAQLLKCCLGFKVCDNIINISIKNILITIVSEKTVLKCSGKLMKTKLTHFL